MRLVVRRCALQSFRALVEALLGEDFREIIDMDAVTHTGVFLRGLHDCDVAVAVVSSISAGAVKNSKCFDVAATQSDDFVAVLSFSSVSVVHGVVGVGVGVGLWESSIVVRITE